jgi:hypothetical protein
MKHNDQQKRRLNLKHDQQQNAPPLHGAKVAKRDIRAQFFCITLM